MGTGWRRVFKGSNTTKLGAAAPGAALLVLLAWAGFKAGGVELSPGDLDLLQTVAAWGSGGAAGGALANSARHLGEGWRRPEVAP